MNAHVIDLYVYAWEIAAMLSLPIVGVVALVGVLVGLVQTVTGISDQNLSFGPKLAAAMAAAAWGGSVAFAMLGSLLRAALNALPYLAR